MLSHVRMMRHGLPLIALLLASGFVQAQPYRAMDNVSAQLESIKEQADALLATVEAAAVNDLPLLWTQAIALEESALPIIQQGIDIAQTVPNPNDVFKKYVIIFEHWHVKVVQTIIIIKITILYIQENLLVPPGTPEAPRIANITTFTNQLRALHTQGETLLGQLDDEPPPTPAQLAAFWAQALALEEQALPITQSGIDEAQMVANPSFILKKWIIIFEHWHIKVVDVIVLIKVIILRLQEEYDLPTPLDQAQIDSLKAREVQLASLESQANALMATIEAVTMASQIPPLWVQVLALEEQVLTHAQQAIDTYQGVVPLGDASPPNAAERPSELLKKELIIIEVWIRRIVLEICVCKLIIIRLEEELNVPQDPAEPQIATITAQTDAIRLLDGQSETAIDNAANATLSSQLTPHYANGLVLEENSIPFIQAGIDAAQTVSNKCTGGANDGLTCSLNADCPGGVCGRKVTELLKKKIVLIEIWWIRLITEICIVKLIVIRWHEIPAVTTWGLVLLTMFVLAAGTVVLRRRRAALRGT